ncbi:MAG: T9SS type A sorting domain-containing protein [Salibacteraceae bacterium]
MKVIFTLTFFIWGLFLGAQHSFQTHLPSLMEDGIYGSIHLNAFETSSNFIVAVANREEFFSASETRQLYFYDKSGKFSHSKEIPNEIDKQLYKTQLFEFAHRYALLFNSLYQSNDSSVSIRIAHYDSLFNLEKIIEIDSVDGFLAFNNILNPDGEIIICYSTLQNKNFGYSITLAIVDITTGKVKQEKIVANNIYGGAISFNYFPKDSSYLIYSKQGAFRTNNKFDLTDSIPFFSAHGAARKLLSSEKSLIYDNYREDTLPFSEKSVDVWLVDSKGKKGTFKHSGEANLKFGKADIDDNTIFQNLDFIEENSIYISFASNFKINPGYPFEKKDTEVGLSKFQADGKVLWTKYYSDSTYAVPIKTMATSDGGALLVCNKYDWRNTTGNFNDIWIIKVDSNGTFNSEDPNLGVGIIDYQANNKITVYPNPAKNEITFKNQEENSNLKIYNTNGTLVFESVIGKLKTIDITDFNIGVYFYSVQNKSDVVSGKFVKE